MQLHEIEFASLLTYLPRQGEGGTMGQESRDLRYQLKNNKIFNNGLSVPQWAAQQIKLNESALPFSRFLNPNVTLVPTPRSVLHKEGSLWVPLQIAIEFVKARLGSEVVTLLHRSKPLPKAASSRPEARPKAEDHYASLAMTPQKELVKISEITLIDDIITRGATMLGAANRLRERFPTTPIRGFAVVRTISAADQFKGIWGPCQGRIHLYPSGKTHREP
jgi:predicted amidophosphoribosyltransferase